MILKIIGVGLAVISLGGLLLCAVGFFSPLTFYDSTDRYCLRLRFAQGGAGLVYDGGADALDSAGFPGKLVRVVFGFPNNFKGAWREHRVFAPPWILGPPLAVYPVVLLVRPLLRRRRRLREGLCIKCGYNLTGNVTGVCPECGAAISRETKPSHVSKASGRQI